MIRFLSYHDPAQKGRDTGSGKQGRIVKETGKSKRETAIKGGKSQITVTGRRHQELTPKGRGRNYAGS